MVTIYDHKSDTLRKILIKPQTLTSNALWYAVLILEFMDQGHKAFVLVKMFSRRYVNLYSTHCHEFHTLTPLDPKICSVDFW